jgi:peroxidase
LDLVTPTRFDNNYFKNLVRGRGLLNSDEELFRKGQGKTTETVKAYAENEELFLKQFAKSMVKLGNISPLTGSIGEIRVNCRTVLS